MTYKFQYGQRVAHYVILKPLGAGGVGEVYLAEDKRLGRKVALKVLQAGLTDDRERLERFKQEARAASALNHPNIITIYEIGVDGDTHYIATEVVDGETLRQRTQRVRLELDELLDIATQTASALAAAHEAGIIHRDIKPENIMLRPDRLVKVLDFGLAKLPIAPTPQTEVDLEATTQAMLKTMPGLIMGTVNYMSPEQSRGKAVDARTDIFSLGALLYEMLAGSAPFAAEAMADVLGALLYKEPEPLAESVPAELRHIVGKALRKNRDERYQSMKGMLADLKAQQELEFVAKLGRRAPAAKGDGAAGSAQESATPESVGAVGTQPAAHPAPGTEPIAGTTPGYTRRLIIALAASLKSAMRGGDLFRPRKQIKSIAVLPFAIEVNAHEIDHISDAITEFLMRSLSRLPRLSVKARTSVFYYKGKQVSLRQVGQELNVQALLTGHIRPHDGLLSVYVDVVDAQTEEILWSNSYDSEMDNRISLESRIARGVSNFLNPRLSGADERKVEEIETMSKRALELYQQGRHFWRNRTPENLKKAIEKFEGAVHEDPVYAQAYIGLADCYALLEDYAGQPARETLMQAEKYARIALMINESLAEAHASLGFVLFNEWKWDEAEKEFNKAVNLNPDYPTTYHWYSVLLRTLGGDRFDEALTKIKKAQELDKLSPIIITNIGVCYLSKGDANSAVKQFQKTIDLYPGFGPAHRWLGLAYLKQGRYDEALTAVQKGVDPLKPSSSSLEFLGYIKAGAGKREEVTGILQKLIRRYEKGEALALNVAAVYAGLDDHEQALTWLETAADDQSGALPFIRMPMFDSLRGHPRYAALLGRMNLTP